MAMVGVHGQVALGDQVWWIPSPAVNSRRCVIIAHGGKLPGDTEFAVPPGLTIAFAVDEGEVATDVTKNMVGVRKGARVKYQHKYPAGGNPCPDYSLAKFVGHGEEQDYRGLRRLQMKRHPDERTPHIVSIRNRSLLQGFSKIIKLSAVVSLIRAHDPGIDKICVFTCREENASLLALLKASVFGG